MRDKLLNANKYCHIYTDVDGITNIHNTETNETYRIIPEISSLGFYLERYKDGILKARNSISFDEMKILTDMAGSNHLLNKIAKKFGELNEHDSLKKDNENSKENDVVKISSEINRILESGIDIKPNSPIHDKLKKALHSNG